MLHDIRLVTLGCLLVLPSAVLAKAIAPRAGPQSVQDAIPSCTTSCLRDFISKNYPKSICADTQSLGCLCTQRSLSGWTLGEAALQCVLTSCPSPIDSDIRVYNLCREVNGAIPNSRSVLSASFVATPTGPGKSLAKPTEAPAITTPINSQATTILSRPPQNSPTSTASEPSSTTAAHQSEDTLNASMPLMPGTSVETTTSSQSLSRNQIIGLSIGSSAACLLGLGLLLFIFLRWRKRNHIKSKEEAFEIGGAMDEPSPRNFSFRLPRMPSTPVGAYNRFTFEPFTALPKVKRLSSVRNKPSDSTRRSWPLSGSVGSDDIELESPSSVRTVSRLLPDKPDFEMFDQHPITEKLTAARPSSSITIFEEDADYRRSSLFGKNSNSKPVQASGSCQDAMDRGLDSFTASHEQPSSMPKPILRQNSVKFANPFAGLSHALVNGTATTQIEKKNLTIAVSLPQTPTSSSVYSSSHSPVSFVTDVRKSPRWSQKSHKRQSTASSTTSFETAASDDEKTRTKATRTARRLSPVKESASRAPSPPKYLQVPPINYSRSLRRNQRAPNPVSTSNEDSRIVQRFGSPKIGSTRDYDRHQLYPMTTLSNEEASGHGAPITDPCSRPVYLAPSRKQQPYANPINGFDDSGSIDPWERIQSSKR